MAGILEEFAYGNVSPEALLIKKDPDYSKAEEFVSYHEQKLLDRLGAEDKEILRRYIDAQSEVKQLTASET